MNKPAFHLLHVDDDQSDAFFFSRALNHCSKDIVPHWMQSGSLALAYLNDRSKAQPTLIVCDVKMPGMSGFEVLKFVRASPRHRRIPVVMFSGSVMPADVDMACDLGANAYVGKPNAPAEFLKAVARIVEFWCDACVMPTTDVAARGTSAVFAKG